MEHSRPPPPEEHLERGDDLQLDSNHAGGVNYIIERPARDGLPEILRVLDDNSDDEANDHPIYISSGEEDDLEEEDVIDDGEDDWSDFLSNDSGYSTMTEDYLDDDDDDEDDDNNRVYDDDDIRSRSPLLQEFPPESFWAHWRQEFSPVPATCPDCDPPAAPQQLFEYPESSVSQRPEESTPSTSGFSSSTKRSREEDSSEQVSSKRLRKNEEENPEEPGPSTSGLSSFTNRGREEDFRDSAPSTSGLRLSTGRRYSPSFGAPGPIFGVPLQIPSWAEDSDSD